jgi:hypothetical protein
MNDPNKDSQSTNTRKDTHMNDNRKDTVMNEHQKDTLMVSNPPDPFTTAMHLSAEYRIARELQEVLSPGDPSYSVMRLDAVRWNIAAYIAANGRWDVNKYPGRAGLERRLFATVEAKTCNWTRVYKIRVAAWILDEAYPRTRQSISSGDWSWIDDLKARADILFKLDDARIKAEKEAGR